MTYNSENRLGKLLTKQKIKNPLYSFLFYGMQYHHSLILTNNKKIDTFSVSSILNYSTVSVKKYDETIDKYKKDGKSIIFLVSERDKLIKTISEKEKQLMVLLEKNLPNTKEIIFCNGLTEDDHEHLIIQKGNLHNLTGPSIWTNNHTNDIFYIDGIEYTESEWNKEPIVRTTKINRLIKKTKLKKNGHK